MAGQQALKAAVSQETPADEITRLRAENEQLRAQSKNGARLSLKVSEKGAISLYGLGRFPVTLYFSQWERILSSTEMIKAFMEEHGGELSTKD